MDTPAELSSAPICDPQNRASPLVSERSGKQLLTNQRIMLNALFENAYLAHPYMQAGAALFENAGLESGGLLG